jgi:hypothetical protein
MLEEQDADLSTGESINTLWLLAEVHTVLLVAINNHTFLLLIVGAIVYMMASVFYSM